MDKRIGESYKLYALTRKHLKDLKSMADSKEKQFGFIEHYEKKI